MKTMRTVVCFLCTATLAGACAEDLRDDTADAGPGADGGGGTTVDGPFTHEDLGDGVTRTVVDATDEEAWAYLDLERRRRVEPSRPEDSIDWDLGFRRFHVMSNGGVSGTGGMEVAVIDGAAFADVTRAPSSGWRTDEPDGEDDDEVPEYAISGNPDPWYDYDTTTHVLTPKERVYVVRTVEANYFKLVIEDYYDEAGTSGHLAFRWAPVDPPEGATVEGLPVDASARDAWVYMRLSDQSIVEPDDPSSSTGWDLALQRTMLRTNSGTSGVGLGGAREADEPWDAIADAPTVGYAVDAMLPLPGPPGAGEFSGNPVLQTWYDYDPATHAVSPRDAVFLVRGAAGDYFALQILDWEDGVFGLRIEPLEPAPRVHVTTIDASDAESWAYLSLRSGELVTPEDASTGTEWDLGFRRTLARTNSGTSGAGMGGALDAEVSGLGDVTEAPGDGYAEDEELDLPGPPGSGTYSGNPALATWYDYDATTHAVTPRDTVFAVRTADGGYAKVKITGWDDGVLTFEWAYAGAGRSAF